ncbi:mucolipin-3-like [Convolutriloba macropyga]|uniref:mucolipin-3-like n=1 Tax=Convolutriloba macropyga TaxID=536237 RepID=UPI003F527B26
MMNFFNKLQRAGAKDDRLNLTTEDGDDDDEVIIRHNTVGTTSTNGTRDTGSNSSIPNIFSSDFTPVTANGNVPTSSASAFPNNYGTIHRGAISDYSDDINSPRYTTQNSRNSNSSFTRQNSRSKSIPSEGRNRSSSDNTLRLIDQRREQGRSMSETGTAVRPTRNINGDLQSPDSQRISPRANRQTRHIHAKELRQQLDLMSQRLQTSVSRSGSYADTSSFDETGSRLTSEDLSSDMSLEEQMEELADKMRHALRLHFLTPWYKWSIRGTLPLRSAIQFISVIIFTLQLCWYASYQREYQLFMDENAESFRHLFLKDWDTDYTDPDQKVHFPYSVYRPEQIAEYIEFAVDEYFTLDPKAIGNWTFCDVSYPAMVSVQPLNMELCVYNNAFNDDNSTHNTVEIKIDPTKSCALIHYPPSVITPDFNLTQFLIDSFGFQLEDNLALFQSMRLRFYLLNQHFGALNVFFEPNCYRFENTLIIDNEYHTGQDPVSLDIQHEALDCGGNESITVYYLANSGVEYIYVIASGCIDIFTITWSVILLLATFRSTRRNWALGTVIKKFWLLYKRKKLEFKDQMEFVNFWNLMTIISCLCEIVGSLIKIFITTELIRSGYSECSMFLGLGVMLSYIAVLQNFKHSSHFNILILALKIAAPPLMRFGVCILCFSIGNSLFAWIVLGGYHYKFETYERTLQTMFSLTNGDDIFNTFAEMSRNNRVVFIISQLWIALFTTLYICFIVGLVIAIVSETYQELKEGKYKNMSEMEIFMNEKNSNDSDYLERTTTRMSCKEAFWKFVKCEQFGVDFERMTVTFEK